MGTSNETGGRAREPAHRGATRWLSVMWFALPLLIVVAATGGAVWLVRTGPKPKKRLPREQAALVTTVRMTPARERVVVRASGTVIPARRIQLRPRVSGEVVAVSSNFMPGGRFKAGEMVVQIDPEDYELTLRILEADVAAAERDYLVELGQQDIAKREWSLVDKREGASELDRALTLREPHLQKALKAREAAVAERRQAELDLERTTVRAPFDAVIVSRSAERGAVLTSQSVVADLAGTETFWVLVALPAKNLEWVRFPGKGSPGAPVDVRLSGGQAVDYEGRVLRCLPGLEEDGRLAQVLVAVEDPLKHADAPLLLGSYVHVAIEGPALDGVFRIPSVAVHEGRNVWLMGPDGRLDIRPVEIVWRHPDAVVVGQGLTDGDLVVVSDLGAPVAGMLLRENGVAAEPERKAASAARGER